MEKGMTDEERIARAAIADTLAVCTQAGDARKADAYADCFAADGILDLGERFNGREAIRLWMAAPSVIPQPKGPSPGFVSHHLTTCRIEMTSERTAQVRTYWLVITAIGVDHSGYYDDRFCKIEEAWRITYRRPRTLWTSPNSLLASSDTSSQKR
jgi:hypothetical protein